MTVDTPTSEARYPGNGSTTVFTVPFYFLANDELGVSLIQDSTGTVTPWVLDVDYTVQGAGNQEGGSITAATAPAVGFTLVIVRDMEEVQPQDYVENDDLPASTLERGLDRLTMLVQQNANKIAKALTIGVGAPIDFSGVVPWVPGSYVKLNASGDGFEPGDGQGPPGPAGDMSGSNNLSEIAINGTPNQGDPAIAHQNIATEALVKDTARAYTKAQTLAEPALVSGVNIAWDLQAAQRPTLDLAHNATLDNPTNGGAGVYMLLVVQTGTFTLAFGTDYVFPDGVPTVADLAVGEGLELTFSRRRGKMVGVYTAAIAGMAAA